MEGEREREAVFDGGAFLFSFFDLRDEYHYVHSRNHEYRPFEDI